MISANWPISGIIGSQKSFSRGGATAQRRVFSVAPLRRRVSIIQLSTTDFAASRAYLALSIACPASGGM